MYVPPAFKADEERALALIEEFPFATLIAPGDAAPSINHLPLLLRRDAGGKHRLIGHMARKNPQWRLLRPDVRMFAVFHGPHTYVTPTWYRQDDVPTWNYAVAHVQASVRLIEDFRGLTIILGKLSSHFEKGEKNPWRFYLPDDLKSEEQLTQAIVGFELHDLQIDAKFKLGQNRSQEDQDGVRNGLAERADEMSLRVRGMMTPK